MVEKYTTNDHFKKDVKPNVIETQPVEEETKPEKKKK